MKRTIFEAVGCLESSEGFIRQDQSTGYAATYFPNTPEIIISPM